MRALLKMLRAYFLGAVLVHLDSGSAGSHTVAVEPCSDTVNSIICTQQS